MEIKLQEFIVRRKIEIELGLGGEQKGLPVPAYDVSLRKDDREESFVIFGDSQSMKRMTPEDAFRALRSRVQLHENKVELSPGLDMLCRETASRLKKFLGPDNYSDFLNL